MKLSIILLIALLLTGCDHSQSGTQRLSSVPLSNTAKTLPTPVKQQAVPPISEITIEREPGMRLNPPPFYALTLRSDGTAIYIGAAFSKRIGTYRASISLAEFVRLAQLAEDSRFISFDPFYGPAVTDIPQVRVSVVRKGKRKTVIDSTPFQLVYEKEAQKSLKQIEQQIDAVVANVKWVKISDNTHLPGYNPELTFRK